MTEKELVEELRKLKRYDVVSRWHDHLEFQNRSVYRIVGEPDPAGDWIKWEDLKALIYRFVTEVEPKVTDYYNIHEFDGNKSGSD